LMTISLLPSILATLPSTAMRYASDLFNFSRIISPATRAAVSG
jgi:hypothetical protein